MKKTERQNGIVHLLRIRKKMTANELAHYFEVSERTIYRDIDALSQLKVPIISYEGLGGGYEIDSSYFMPSIKLSEKEVLMLLMVLKLGEELRIPNMIPDYKLLTSKVTNALTDQERQEAEKIMSHIEFDIIRILPKNYISDVLIVLLEAFRSTSDLELIYYHPEKNKTEVRRVSPIKLFFDEGGWYVTGYCHRRKAKRTFRLDRIVELTCLEQKNEYLNIQLPTSEEDKYRSITYELVIESALYRIIKDNIYLQDCQVKPVERGFHLTVTTPYKDEIQQLALSHPEEVTVLKPDELIQEMRELGEAIYKKYSKP
jgi:predicted DNA-binding transcriptional regulator YafY